MSIARFLFLALLLATSTVSAQIKLVGTQYNQAASLNEVLRFDASTGAILNTITTTQSSVSLGSTVFDAFTGKYYFRSGPGLNSAEFDPDGYAYVGTIDILTSAEIDMASGQIYGARSTDVLDSTGGVIQEGVEFVRYDIVNNTATALGSFARTFGIAGDGSAYNSNSGTYYFIGSDSVQGICLYTVPTRDSVFSYTQVPINTSNQTFYALEYDNEYNVLYGLNFIDLGTSANIQLHQVTPSTGALVLEADWPQFINFQSSSHTFDQTSSSFIFKAIDNNGFQLAVYRTVQNTLNIGVLPSQYVNGLEADNSQFAASKYGSITAVTPASRNAVQLYPNPATDILRVEGVAFNTLQLTDLQGRSLSLERAQDVGSIDVSRLPAGIYLLQGRRNDGSFFSSKFIKS
jgi:hypothetical protein